MSCGRGDAGAAKEAPAVSDPGNAKADGGASEAALPTCGTAELLTLLPHDDRHVLVAEYLWLNDGGHYRYDPDAAPVVASIDTYDGTEQVVAHLSLRGGRVLLDGDGRPRFAVGRNERDELTVAWQPEPEGRWRVLRAQGIRAEGSGAGEARRRCGVRDVHRPAHSRCRARRSIVWTCARMRRPSCTSTRSPTSARPCRACRETRSSACASTRRQPEYHWLVTDDPSVKLYASLQRAFPGQSVEITSATADLHQAIAFVQSDVNPGDYYLVDTQTRNAQYLRSARSWVDPTRMRHKEAIEIKARDGLVLHGYLTRPRAERGPYQLVVPAARQPYDSRDEWTFDPDAQLLAEYGYAVLQVNYRGSSGYGDEFMHAGFREWGGKMQDDLTDATHWAIEQGHRRERQHLHLRHRLRRLCGAHGRRCVSRGLYQCAAAYNGLYDLELVLARDDPRIGPAARGVPRRDSRHRRANAARALTGGQRCDLDARCSLATGERVRPSISMRGSWRQR